MRKRGARNFRRCQAGELHAKCAGRKKAQEAECHPSRRPGHPARSSWLCALQMKCAATGVNSMDTRADTAPLESCCLAWRSCICQRSSRVGLPPLLSARWSLCPHPPCQTLPAIPSAGCPQRCTSALAKLPVGQVSRLLRPLSRWASLHAGTRPNFLILQSASSSTLTETARFVQKKRPQVRE